jgi:hypothetical protein
MKKTEGCKSRATVPLMKTVLIFYNIALLRRTILTPEQSKMYCITMHVVAFLLSSAPILDGLVGILGANEKQ